MAKRVVMCSIALLVAGLGFADPGPDSVELTRTATILGPASSPPDHLLAAVTVTVAAGVNVAGSLTAFAIQENIPSGWTYISVDSTPAPAVDGPDPNNPEILNFVWVELPNLSSPFTMTYTLAIPASSTGGSITGQVLYRTSGGPLTSVPVTTQQDFFNCLLMTRTAPANYRAGDQVTVTVSVTSFCGTSSTQPLTAMGIEETIPATWSLVSVSGNSGDIQPAPGATGTLSFGWTTPPAAFPITFSYVLNVPQDASGNAQIDGVILSRLGPSEELTSPREVTSIAYIPTALVPNVTGQTETDARAAIEAVGLTVGTVTRQCNNTQPENTVLEQSPTSGTRLDLGEPVDLVVSNGPCQVTVPDVVGQTLSSAISTLLSAGFQIGTATQQCHATYPGETIIGQDPPGDSTALYGSAVNLVLSSGPCQVAVPNVTGQTQSAAAAAITDAGLTVGTVTQQCSDTVPAGSVISQDPVAGTQITSGSAVDLVVSNGPCQSVVSVPDVTGQTESAATAAITGAGLTVGSITTQCSDTAPAGSVISQVPAAGTQVQPGATVDLVISTGACNAIVPDVVGLSLEAAQAALSVYSFTVNTTDACSDTVPAGNVISQNPVAGTLVSSGISVNLVVSSGKPIVPDVTGLLQANAEAAITGVLGLSVGTISFACSDTISAGNVISQSVEPGETACDTSIDLVISTGACDAIVPDVLALTLEEAQSALSVYGFAVNVSEACSDTVPAGSIISQYPVGGTPVTQGSTVDLVVSTGPCPVTVPDVTNQTESAANVAITGAGLTVGTVTTQCSDTVPAGSVISQNPLAGTSVQPETAVDLVISSGPCLMSVPDVIGQTQGAAQAAITAAGLAVGQVTQQCSDTVAAGSVIGQSPAAGTSVQPGSAVDLVVSSGPCLVAVPNVVGQAQAAAQAAIEASGLAVGQVTTQCSDTVPAGQVISQNPDANTQVAPGSAVNLVVSAGPAVVPNVVGQAQAAATAAITAAGLTVGAVQEVYSTQVSEGTVIAQSPAAGATLTCGAAVNLLVSKGAPENVPTNREIMQQIHDGFGDLDADGDGNLSLEETLAALPNLPWEIFDSIDADNDDYLTLDELKQYLKISGCFGCIRRLFVKDLLVSAGGDLLLAGLGVGLLLTAGLRRPSR